MKTTIIFGAGQGGRMALRLLSAEYEVSAFCDNNRSLHGASVCGVPVISPNETDWEKTDCAIISVFNKDAAKAIKEQLREYNFLGEVVVLTDLRRLYDARLASIRLFADEIHSRKIEGDVAELGVYRGDTAVCLNSIFPDRTLRLFDTFSGFSSGDILAEAGRSFAKEGDFSDTSEEYVLSRLPHPERAITYAGRFPESFPNENFRFCLVSLDADLYLPTLEGLRLFYPRLAKGGAIIVHDYNSTQFRGVRDAVNEFCTESGAVPFPLCDLHGSCVILSPSTRE